MKEFGTQPAHRLPVPHVLLACKRGVINRQIGGGEIRWMMLSVLATRTLSIMKAAPGAAVGGRCGCRSGISQLALSDCAFSHIVPRLVGNWCDVNMEVLKTKSRSDTSRARSTSPRRTPPKNSFESNTHLAQGNTSNGDVVRVGTKLRP
jgi:hypothetical protein